jgi:hypothetical protein
MRPSAERVNDVRPKRGKVDRSRKEPLSRVTPPSAEALEFFTAYLIVNSSGRKFLDPSQGRAGQLLGSWGDGKYLRFHLTIS